MRLVLLNKSYERFQVFSKLTFDTNSTRGIKLLCQFYNDNKMARKERSVPEVHQSLLFGVKKIDVDKGKWHTSGPDATGCLRYNLTPHRHSPDEEFSLIVTTQDEKAKYYFYHKNYLVKLCPDKILEIKYTKKKPA